MEFKKLLEKRQSARIFSERQISREDLTEIIREAGLAPSWGNSQPWKVYAATGETLKKIKAEHLKKSEEKIKGSSELPVMEDEDWSAESRKNIKELMEDLNMYFDDKKIDFFGLQGKLYNAQALVYLTVPKASRQWSYYDLGAFAQNLLLSAADKGIGSIPAYEIVKYPEIVRKNIEISSDEVLAAGIALGYAEENDVNRFSSRRMPLEEFLTIKD